ncbi:MAG: hypothetical protein A2150_06160 [Candidatus Muproteobacteria bacterium RBG_16_64_11]|uniref:LysM domain-containing protein n=1 Tax=Candidatus Muproteobacteria bacterium RBG_16_64_11 TaxID=1817758 RepID=A0A1F6T9H3_9PROT|nr:MAG: hypothetical protein A2150_06160 [Candidatus Muproteobacteria bacterium RBG_16_64_11]
MSPNRHAFRTWVLAVCLAVTGLALADVVQLAANPPDRYTVIKGDTLWGIAARFLKEPWYWPRVWKINEHIKNPHLIYPGDVLVLRRDGGQPQIGLDEEFLSPRARTESRDDAIVTVPPGAILPYLHQQLVVSNHELEKAGYVTVGMDGRVALGDHDQFYARGLGKKPDEFYQLFRPGKPLRNPDNGEVLGYEAIYLGDATLMAAGDPSKLAVTRVAQEIGPTDRLIKAPPRTTLPHYFPRAPKNQVSGRILSGVNALREFGPLAVVAISLGKREGMEEGHVLRIMRHAGRHKDPITKKLYQLPDEESGLLMVFRVFDKASYALIMDANRPIHLHDVVQTP